MSIGSLQRSATSLAEGSAFNRVYPAIATAYRLLRRCFGNGKVQRSATFIAEGGPFNRLSPAIATAHSLLCRRLDAGTVHRTLWWYRGGPLRGTPSSPSEESSSEYKQQRADEQ